MDQRQTQTRLARALRAGRRCRDDRADAGVSDHAVQSADTAHDGDLVPDAALVAARDSAGFARDSHAYDRIVARRSLVESGRDVAADCSDTWSDVARAAEPFRVDVQSTAESRVRESC